MGCGQSKKNSAKKTTLKIKELQNRKFKLVLLGSVSVGKTSIAAKYCSNKSAQDYGPTVGGVYYKKESTDRSGDTFTQNIWDTAG